MSEILRKSRKQHFCACCDGKIKSGKLYLDCKGRAARYDDEDYDRQIGIEYYAYKLCLVCGGPLPLPDELLEENAA